MAFEEVGSVAGIGGPLAFLKRTLQILRAVERGRGEGSPVHVRGALRSSEDADVLGDVVGVRKVLPEVEHEV
jgi:hypothetical protein